MATPGLHLVLPSHRAKWYYPHFIEEETEVEELVGLTLAFSMLYHLDLIPF